MKIYKIPFFESKREEKIFGGYLSVRQVFYILLGICPLSLLFLPITKFIGITFSLITISLSLLCAFLKIKGVTFDKYLINMIRYAIRNKKYTYKGVLK